MFNGQVADSISEMLADYVDEDDFVFEFLAFVNKGNYNKTEIPSFFDFAANLELLKDP